MESMSTTPPLVLKVVSYRVCNNGVPDRSTTDNTPKLIVGLLGMMTTGTYFNGGTYAVYSPELSTVETMVVEHPPPCWEVRVISATPILFFDLPRPGIFLLSRKPPTTLPTTFTRVVSLNLIPARSSWKS